MSIFEVNRDISIAFFRTAVFGTAQDAKKAEAPEVGAKKTWRHAQGESALGISTVSIDENSQFRESGGHHQIQGATSGSERQLVLPQQLDQDGDLKLYNAGPDLDSSYLFERWEQCCEEGDIFLVTYPEAKRMPLKPSTSETIDPLIVESSNSYKFGSVNTKRKKWNLLMPINSSGILKWLSGRCDILRS